MSPPADKQPASKSFEVPRKHPRIPLTIEIRCEGAGRSERFISKDLSNGGIFLYTTRVYPIDARVSLLFFIPYHHEQLEIAGRVVRHSQDAQTGLVDGMGISFEDLADGARRSLEEYMERTKA